MNMGACVLVILTFLAGFLTAGYLFFVTPGKYMYGCFLKMVGNTRKQKFAWGFPVLKMISTWGGEKWETHHF